MKLILETGFKKNSFADLRKRFAKDESGAVFIFALMLFVLMAMMGGIAVDLMRYETTRTTLQNTLDRSTLAAASLSQKLDPEAVVRDYVAKVGLTQFLTSVTVVNDPNYRNVNAKAMVDTQPFFLHMIGVDEFKAPGSSTAEQRVSNVEVMLVLDVSGSMAGTKMTNLKSAASEFVETVLTSNTSNLISIGIVPYNGQVNLGPVLSPRYQLINPTGVSDTACVDLAPGAYTTTVIPRNVNLSATAYADTFSGTDTVTGTNASSPYSDSNKTPTAGNRWCPPSTVNVVRPPNNDVTNMKTYINNLTAIGATSTNAGLKWGMALLDPDSRPLFATLASTNKIPSSYSNRPFDYTDKNAMKVIVLMTDGDHFVEERVGESYKSGMSPIYKGSDGYYSIRHQTGRPTAAGTKEYFTPHLCTTTNCKNGSNTGEAWRSTVWSSGVQQTWPQVWSSLRTSWVAWQLYARALGNNTIPNPQPTPPAVHMSVVYNNWMANFRAQTATADMDTQLQAICSLAKGKKNVEIYGIAFDAPTNGQQQIKRCTTGYDPAKPNDGNAYYFASTPTNIKTAFRAIANNISQLRLTQ